MSVHQLIDPLVVYLDLLAEAPAGGGKLHFYEIGTTTPKTTWQDFAKTIPNANPVELDSAGRIQAPVWGDGDYTVVFKDADGSTIVAAFERRDPVPASSGIPDATGHDGEYLTSAGGVLAWSGTWWPNPDPTGSAGEQVTANGAGDGYILQAQAAIPEPDIVIGDTSITIGDGDGERWMEQTGTATIPSSGSRTSNVPITFPVAFTKIRHVDAMASTYAVNEYGAGATITAAGFTVGAAATGATLTANIVDDGGDSGDTIVNPISVTWKACGLVAAA